MKETAAHLAQGQITISRPIYGSGKEAIVIAVTDMASRVRFLEVEIGYADFTQALTGLGNVPCQYELRHLERVGKIREHKTEFIPLPPYGSPTDPKELLALHEVDGWVGDPGDIKNQNRHRRQEDGKSVALVSFVRYVEREKGDADA